MLPEYLEARLRFEARRRGASVAELAREAISAYLPEPPGHRPASFIGLGEGDEHLSEHVDELVGEAIARRHADPEAGG